MKAPSPEPRDRDRFLAAVAERVPVDRVVELYLFQPIRQGGVESGVAVIAADSPPVENQPGTATVHSGDGAADAADPVAPRYTVFTARYRHVLKGPDRGKWDVSVVAEADAPLETLGAVVRGVQRRAGDTDPPEHITGEALRDVLGQGRASDQ
jgi:hypothetical protein